MTGLRKSLAGSRFGGKLIRRILVIELICFIVISMLSFVVLRPVLRSQSLDIAGQIQAQMVLQLDSALESVVTTSQFIATSPELKNALGGEAQISDTGLRLVLNSLAASRQGLGGIVLHTDDGRKIDSIFSDPMVDQMLESSWYQLLRQNEYQQDFRLLPEDGRGSQTVVFARNCYIGATNCVLTLVCNLTDNITELSSLSRSVFNYYGIVDEENTLLYTNTSGPSAELLKIGTGDNRHTIDTPRGVLFVDPVKTNLWRVVSFADNSLLSLSYRSYQIAAILLLVLLSILTLVLVTPAVNHSIQPINKLASAMRKVSGGDLRSRANVVSDDEIGELSEIFNHMVDGINQSIHQRIEHEQTEQKMKYNLLISQIDPHFIYNTMSIITMLAKTNRTEEIVTINNALIKILKDRLRVNGIEVLDTVEQEIDTVRQYLVIQGYRYDNRVKVAWDIDSRTLFSRIPKNVIQPLVENALFHGLMDEETGVIDGIIKIQVRLQDKGTLICISDNGRGMPADKIEALYRPEAHTHETRGRHIGLRNINERLFYIYGQENMLRIDGASGTQVSLLLPHADS